MRVRKAGDDRPIVAICYDFDKTLSPKDMQEYTLFSKLGIDAKSFWSMSNSFAVENGMDKILSYMKLIVKLAKEREETLSLVKKDFSKMGKDVELFSGLDTWFTRIDAYGESIGLRIEHYIISAGLKEIIEGTRIAKYFTEIYASCFVYTKSGIPIWPKQVVNYTQKTQYLFRINKDCRDLSDEKSINATIPENSRRIPFRNFIYIGDSETDIPAMKVIKKEKGQAIGVYDPRQKNVLRVCELLDDDRINYFAPADYSEGSLVEVYVKNVLDNIKTAEALDEIHQKQAALTSFLSHIDSVYKYFHDSATGGIDLSNIEILDEIKRDALKFFKDAKKQIAEKYKGQLYEAEDILLLVDKKREDLENYIKKIKRDVGEKATNGGEQNESR